MIENYDRLTDAEKVTMASLPYRVGLWMSTLESSGGDMADELEGLAMIEAIEQISTSPHYDFAAYLCRQTLAMKNRWMDWSSDFSRVPDECRAAMDLLRRTIPQEAVIHFSEALFLIAASVAKAHREETARTGFGDFPGLVSRLMGQVQNAVGGAAGHQNISSTEAAALQRLSSILGLQSTPRALP